MLMKETLTKQTLLLLTRLDYEIICFSPPFIVCLDL